MGPPVRYTSAAAVVWPMFGGQLGAENTSVHFEAAFEVFSLLPVAFTILRGSRNTNAQLELPAVELLEIFSPSATFLFIDFVPQVFIFYNRRVKTHPDPSTGGGGRSTLCAAVLLGAAIDDEELPL